MNDLLKALSGLSDPYVSEVKAVPNRVTHGLIIASRLDRIDVTMGKTAHQLVNVVREIRRGMVVSLFWSHGTVDKACCKRAQDLHAGRYRVEPLPRCTTSVSGVVDLRV